MVSCERRLHDTLPFMGLGECIVYLATNCRVAGVTEPEPPLGHLCIRERRISEFKVVIRFIS